METRANYVLIGGFTILTTVFLLLFALWAVTFSSARSWRQYEVVFTEPVTGLTEGGGVQYNGISVGTVDNLSLAPDDARKVIALLKVALSLAVSWSLSRSVLRGEASAFSLELPPYRPPRNLQTLYTSLIDRTVFVLWRAIVFAVPAGVVI